jgi:ABC-type lipoprotein release transport system permease subunit
LPILLGALLGAPLVAAIASYLPTLLALTEDPAVVLRDQ